MIRTQIQLTAEQAQLVRMRARALGISQAEVIRRCIDVGMEGATTDATERFARARRVIGAFLDPAGATDLARRHDDYLGDA